MLKKIPTRELKPGMYLHGMEGSWLDHPFWRNQFVLDDPADIRRILESGIAEVWIDTARGLDVSAAPAEPAHAVEAALMEAEIRDLTEHPVRTTRDQELPRAAKLLARSRTAIVSMFSELRMGRAVNAEAAQALVEDIAASLLRNPGALVSLARLKSADDYTYLHSVAVCALMIALARQLGLSEADTREAGMAGLLHDIGKAVMPMDVLNKPGKLTDAEFRIIKRHPVEGYRLLVEGGSVSDIVRDVCLHHHEKINGSGYPDGLAGDAISLFARMGAVCDVYDAITSNRPYKRGWDPAESIRKMTEWRAGHFDERVFQAFVKSLGIYPTGSLVRLRSGRLAVVLEQSEKSLLAPRVKVFFSTKSQARIVPEILDLSRPGHTDGIIGHEDPAHWGFDDLDALWAS